VLVKAEPVSGIVAKQGLDAVGPLGRPLQEGDALGDQPEAGEMFLKAQNVRPAIY